MKNVKKSEIFFLEENVVEVFEKYYLNDTCVENRYEGSDEDLLKALKPGMSITIAIHKERMIRTFFNLECSKDGSIIIKYTNMFSRNVDTYNINLSELVCKDKKIISLNKTVPKYVEREFSTLVYLIDFKDKYPYTVERFDFEKLSSRFSSFKNKHAFTITEKSASRIVYFPFVSKLEEIDYTTLPEFMVSCEAVQMIDKKVGEDYLKESIIYPFSEFVINIEGTILLCKLNDDKTMLRVLLKDENGKSIFVANCKVDIGVGFTLLILNGFPKEYKDPRKFAANFLAVLAQVLYYYSHYKIEYEVVETKCEEKNSKRKNFNETYKMRKRETSTTIVPRKVVKINKERVKSVKKRREPLYSVATWKRTAHIRRYKDALGNVIKEVKVREATCNRHEALSFDEEVAPKKIFKVSTDAISMATKY